MAIRDTPQTHLPARPVARLAGVALAVMFFALAGTIDPAFGDPIAVNATVAWTRDERIYITISDSLALEPGDLLTFTSRGKPIATGEVARAYDRELALATLTSGSLKKEKRLERVRILVERPPMRAPALLRIGVPSAQRQNLLFSCPGLVIRPPLPDSLYRSEVVNERSYRLVRMGVADAPWPDTLHLRLFDDPADEEIALERGHLDVAIFWPGELSTHLRQDPKWRDFSYGNRPRGVIAARAIDNSGPGDSTMWVPDWAALYALNRDLFRGDLDPWHREPLTTNSNLRVRADSGTHYNVDPALPGSRTMERFLNRVPYSKPARTVRLSYVDAPASAPPANVTPIFTVRCPIVGAPELRRYVSALGAGVLADMLVCGPKDRP